MNAAQALSNWSDTVLHDILVHPRMWGGNESVECQVLLLLKMRHILVSPEHANQNPRFVIQRLGALLKEETGSGVRPAHTYGDERFLGLMREFVSRTCRELQALTPTAS